MLIFWIIAIVLILLTLAGILPALLMPNALAKTDGNLEKRDIFRQQFDELEQDKTSGVLDETQYSLAKSELERRMLDEIGTNHVIASNIQPDHRLAAALLVLLPLVSILLYYKIGNPSILNNNPTAGVSGLVSVAPALAAQVNPSDTVYIFALATKGSPMPLAAMRITAKELPYNYHLDDRSAIMEGNILSQANEVMLVARITKSGDAQVQTGDLQGKSKPVKPDSTGVDIEINDLVK